MVSRLGLCVLSLATVNIISSSVTYPQTEEDQKLARSRIAVSMDGKHFTSHNKLTESAIDEGLYFKAPVEDHYTRKRKGRSVSAASRIVGGVTGILRGLLAVRGLLKGAKEIPSETTIIREFEKPGGYGHTINDFLSVHPTNIRTFDVVDGTIGRMGRVGDRKLYLYNPKDGYPELQIVKIRKSRATNEPYIDRITYVE